MVQIKKDNSVLIKKLEETKIHCNSLAAYLSKASDYTKFLIDEIRANENTIEQIKAKYNQKLSTLMA